MSRTAGLSLHWFAGVATHDPDQQLQALRAPLPRRDVTIESTAGFELALELTVKATLAGRRVAEVPDHLARPDRRREQLQAAQVAAALPALVRAGLSGPMARGEADPPGHDRATARSRGSDRPPGLVHRASTCCGSSARRPWGSTPGTTSAPPPSGWPAATHGRSAKAASPSPPVRIRCSSTCPRASCRWPRPWRSGWSLGACATVWLIRRLDLPLWWLLFPPLLHSAWNGNPQSLALALLVAGGSIAASLAVGLKLYAGVPLLGRWRDLVVASIALLVTLPLLPWQLYLDQGLGVGESSPDRVERECVAAARASSRSCWRACGSFGDVARSGTPCPRSSRRRSSTTWRWPFRRSAGTAGSPPPWHSRWCSWCRSW